MGGAYLRSRIKQAGKWDQETIVSFFLCQYCSGEYLLANGTIEPSYVAALYRSHEELGPYYVLGPGLAMPHARPEDGVNRLGLALTVLKEGVNFGSEGNDPVRLLVTLAASDSNSHVETIAQLAELFMNEEDVAAIMAATSKDDILRILARY